MKSELLHVVTTVFNPARFRSRYELFQRFEKQVQDAGAKLWVVELAFGDRPFEVTQAGNPQHLQLRTLDEIWLKENSLNLMVQRLPADWRYVAWVDADVRFARPDWAAETVHQLQHYEVVQMFSVAHDLTPGFSTYQTHMGFVWCMHEGYQRRAVGYKGEALPAAAYGSGGVPVKVAGKIRAHGAHHASMWHPGYAWAATREAFDAFGGLLDTAILGAADNHMAHGLYGMADLTLGEGPAGAYRDAVLGWQDRAKALHQDVGYVPGDLFHDFHGKKRDRRYTDRWKILRDHKFDPRADLTRDWQGLWRLRPERAGLRDDLRKYFRSRHEDSIDIE